MTRLVSARHRWLGFAASLVLLVSCRPISAEEPFEVEWSRQLGTASHDTSHAVAIADLEAVYIGGETIGDLGGAHAGNGDAYLTKYDLAGNLLWTRQSGTAASDYTRAVATDLNGHVYAGGSTEGSFAAPNAGASDAFFSKYDAAGNVLWSRQIGSSASDGIHGITVDSSGSVFITGLTTGSLAGPNVGGYDAFLAKYGVDGQLAWSRQLGTPVLDYSNDVAVDSAGNAYITGITQGSLGGDHVGAFDAFLAKYDPLGNLLWSRQLGTQAEEQSRSVAIDGEGNAYISGSTFGSLSSELAGTSDALLAKYDPQGNLLWTRQIGAPLGISESNAAAVDSLGNPFIAGYTSVALGQQKFGAYDFFLLKYDPAGNLQWSQQVGTEQWDVGMSLALDARGHAYLTGETYGSLGDDNAGMLDAVLIKLVPVPEPGCLYFVALSGLAFIAKRRG